MTVSQPHVRVIVRLGLTIVALVVSILSVPVLSQPGLPVDVMLPDQTGKPRTLRSALAGGGGIVVLCRAAREPACRGRLLELERRRETLAARGLSVGAVVADSHSVVTDLARTTAVAFPLFSDTGQQVAKALALSGRPSAVVVVDAGGRVRALRADDAKGERATLGSILAKSGAPGSGPSKRVTTTELTVTTSASDETVAPGDLFALVLDIVPRPQMHIYAPGAKGYRAITLRPDASSRVFTARALELPPSETYYFAPLNERVPVYQRAFRITQELAVTAAASPTASGAIAAVLEYQACSDDFCFDVVKLPLAWSVRVVGPTDPAR